MEENRGMGGIVGGGWSREKNECLVWCVAGRGGAPVNKERKKKDKEMEKEL